jgi:hypothetical protein
MTARKNASLEQRRTTRKARHNDDGAPQPLTCEGMAFDLVRRGLRGKEILDGMFHGLGDKQSP